MASDEPMTQLQLGMRTVELAVIEATQAELGIVPVSFEWMGGRRVSPRFPPLTVSLKAITPNGTGWTTFSRTELEDSVAMLPNAVAERIDRVVHSLTRH
jgi:hypothetical protein